MAVKISDLSAQTNIADDDILHLRTAGGVDRKITGANVALEFATRAGNIRKVITKTAIAVGDPVTRWANYYGNYKVEQIQAQLQTDSNSVNAPRGLRITKDYTTGRFGFVAVRGDEVRIGELDADGNGFTLLTANTVYASVNPPTTSISAAANIVMPIHEAGGRHRFMIVWHDTAGGGNNAWARIGEYDGGGGITFLTAETLIDAAPAGRYKNAVMLDDGQHIMIITSNLTLIEVTVLKWVSGTSTLTVAVGPVTVYNTGGTNLSNVHQGMSLGHDNRAGIIMKVGNSGGTRYMQILVLQFTAPATVNLLLNKALTARGFRSAGANTFMTNGWHGGSGGFTGHHWRTVIKRNNSQDFYVDSGDFQDDGDFNGHVAYLPIDSPTNDNSVSEIYGVQYNEDKAGYMAIGFDIISPADSHAMTIGRWKGKYYSTIIPGNQIGDAGNCVGHGGDLLDGIAAFKYVLNADGFSYADFWRCPYCVGVALDAGAIDDEIRVLEFGAGTMDFETLYPNQKPYNNKVYSWDPKTGLFLPGDYGYDIKINVIDTDQIFVSRMTQGV